MIHRPGVQLARRSVHSGIAVLALLLCAAVAVSSAPTSQAVTFRQRLLGAPVPSLCGYPAGRLVNGRLPGTGEGEVVLDSDTTVVGTLVKGGGTGAAAVFSCDQGGVGWPQQVVFYNRNLRIIGRLDTGRVGVNSGRAKVAKVSIKKRVATVYVTAVGEAGDFDLWGSAGARVTFAYDAKRKQMAQRSVKVYSEAVVAKQLLSLVRAGKLSAAHKIASADVVTEVGRLVKRAAASSRNSLKMTGCIGQASGYVPSDVDWSLGQRGCYFTLHAPDPATGDDYGAAYVVMFRHPANDRLWAKWYATAAVGVAG